MSLRAKILLAVAAVNLGVTALLAVFFFNDLERREQALREREKVQVQEAKAALVRSFGGFLVGGGLELEGPERGRLEVAGILRRLLNHPVRSIIEDGIVLNRYSYTAEGEILPTDVYVNLLGAKDRETGFDERRVQRQIARSIESGSVLVEDGWISAPIRLRSLTDPPGEGQPWGGGGFRLTQPLPPARWLPTFQPRTLVLGMIAGTLILVILTYLLLERWILQPLGLLGRGAERVADRHFDRPVPGGGEDEIGRLVRTFNAMMAEVGDAQQTLTQRVEEATQREAESRRGLVIAQRLAATGTLASGIAHEINNPLGGMINAVRRIRSEAERRGDDDSIELRYTGLLQQGLEQIQGIVRRALAFSPRRVEPTRVHIREIVEGAAALARHRARRAQVEFDIQGDDAWILVEPGEIQQVFLNLLINACDAMTASGGHVRITVRAQPDWVEVLVADTGHGMTEDQRERAFDLFFSTKEVGQGTGLGLSVAHHIVTQHGGSLTVTSKVNVGTTFCVRLPAAPVS